MTLTDKIRKELRADIPQLLEDIQTFTNMKIPRELIITNHHAYKEQIKRLEQHKKDNTANLKNYIEKHLDKVVEELIKDLATKPQFYITTDTINADSNVWTTATTAGYTAARSRI